MNLKKSLKKLLRNMELKTELKDFQKETLEWMKLHEKKHDGGMLCNEAGLGKSLCSLALIIEKPKKTLIVCPAGLVDNWVNEIEKHTTLHRLKYVKYYGPDRQTKYIRNDTLIYITSYSIIAREFDGGSFKKDSLFAKTEFKRIILDEAHYIRNSCSNAAKSVLYLGSLYKHVIKKWVITATPVYNHVNDTFNYFKFVELEGIDDKKDWTNTITKKINGLYKLNGWMEKHSISLKKKDVLKELKQKNEIKISLKFNKLENDFYESLKAYSYTRMKSLINRIKHLKSFQDIEMKRLLRANVLTFILRLKQACNSPWLILKNMERLKRVDNLEDAIECLNTANSFFKKNKETPDEDCLVCYDVKGDYISKCGHKCCKSCWDKILEFKGECPVCRAYVDKEDLQHTKKKVKKIKERTVDIEEIELTKMAIEKNEKIVIVSQWVGMLNIIRHVFEDELPNVKYINLQGNIPLVQRTKNIKRFETKKSVKVCFLSLMSSSEGINLVSANHLVFVDCWWNKSKMIQGADRIHRIGQTKQVNIYNLQVKDSIEEKIEMLVEKKTKMGNLILNKWTIKNTKKYDASWIHSVIKLLEPIEPQE
jgi:SNF2 family DNA or RNA helicase